jgi:hypothetical protein
MQNVFEAVDPSLTTQLLETLVYLGWLEGDIYNNLAQIFPQSIFDLDFATALFAASRMRVCFFLSSFPFFSFSSFLAF